MRLAPMWLAILAAAAMTAHLAGSGDDDRWPRLFFEDFEDGAGRWQPTDPQQWKVVEQPGRGRVYSQFVKQSAYQPPHRSPFNIALRKDTPVGDFELTAKVRSTHAPYGHRDVCVVFGYQDPAHFYYVHFGQQADDHANQIFIVDDAPRIKISEQSTDGTKWDDQWHTVRIRRTVSDGLIEVFFDDMEQPVMRAHNKRLAHGRVGLGSFDDTSQWDDVELRGVAAGE